MTTIVMRRVMVAFPSRNYLITQNDPRKVDLVKLKHSKHTLSDLMRNKQ